MGFANTRFESLCDVFHVVPRIAEDYGSLARGNALGVIEPSDFVNLFCTTDHENDVCDIAVPGAQSLICNDISRDKSVTWQEHDVANHLVHRRWKRRPEQKSLRALLILRQTSQNNFDEIEACSSQKRINLIEDDRLCLDKRHLPPVNSLYQWLWSRNEDATPATEMFLLLLLLCFRFCSNKIANLH